MNEVKQLENADLSDENDGVLMYENIEVSGKKAVLLYKFNSENELCEAGYVFKEEHTNDNLYIDDYYDVMDNLKKKYNDPELDKLIWKDNTYKDEKYKDHRGLLVSNGTLQYVSSWATENTSISLILSGDNYQINMSLLYSSTKFDDDSQDTTEGL